MDKSITQLIIWLTIGLSLFIHIAALIVSNTVLKSNIWSMPEAHASIEMFGSSIALFLALLLIVFEKSKRGTSHNIEIACAMIAMGTLDGFHAIVPVGQQFVWLHSLATLFGGLLFASFLFTKSGLSNNFIAPCIVFTASIFVGVISLAYPTFIPVMVRDGVFTQTAMWLNIIGGIGFFIAAFKLIQTNKQNDNINDLLFSMNCLLFGAAAIMFEQSALWDLAWWGWHLLRLMAYLVAVIFLVLEGLVILKEIKHYQSNLEQTVQDRTQALESANHNLNNALSDLTATQAQLIQKEKMASLGELVAGVAHEINTPIGVGITSSTFLEQNIQRINRAYKDNTLSPEELAYFIDTAEQTCALLTSNLQRAALLVSSFKLVVVEPSGVRIRKFKVKDCLEGIVFSVNDSFKHARYRVILNCDSELTIISQPETLSKIISNLIINSVNHAFDFSGQTDVNDKRLESQNKEALIKITLSCVDEQVHLIYEDNGKGLTDEQKDKIFDPFFTTSRNLGCVGLGAHIIYNQVIQGLKGSIELKSTINKGTRFDIKFSVHDNQTSSDYSI
ncbi:sensor histidine kinase [Shewanella sp. UCD-KL12]|uniref:sensor histidine kinase n=1 Tax=Shewanella sp. UCD-KL12 TaxID=1917163 RepID=UPI00117E21B7|nr:ATP-binding protein [Shewanella sp. UCD-KL12]